MARRWKTSKFKSAKSISDIGFSRLDGVSAALTEIRKRITSMRKGVPTPEQLVDDEVTFFSLDTDVIQAAGYNFEKGALNQLPRQLPRSMELQLTEVVLKEIVDHRMKPVKVALSKFQGATADLQRLTAFDFAPACVHVRELNVLAAAEEKFSEEVRKYVAQCRGDVLLLSDVDPERLFKKYFAGKPPFGFKADKKAEFPDAEPPRLSWRPVSVSQAGMA
jgi:hypothetical protein